MASLCLLCFSLAVVTVGGIAQESHLTSLQSCTPSMSACMAEDRPRRWQVPIQPSSVALIQRATDLQRKLLKVSEARARITAGEAASGNVYEKVNGVGAWGGWCTCPDGQRYNVGDKLDGCANGPDSLSCEGGIPGACEKTIDMSRAGMKATCAAADPMAPSTYTTTMPMVTDNIYEKVTGVGAWGGWCTCPDGQRYNVGDKLDGCANGPDSLACEGGTPGACEKTIDMSRAGMRATCVAADLSSTSSTLPASAPTSQPSADPTVPAGCPYSTALPPCQVPSSLDWIVQSSCMLQSGSYSLRKVLVADGVVLVVEQGAEVTLELTGGILVADKSQLWIGCEGMPFTGRMTTTFKGSLSDLGSRDHTFTVDYHAYDLPVRTEVWANGLFVSHGGRFESHGITKTSWARLQSDAESGVNTLILDRAPQNWGPGDEIVITSTSTSDLESERARISKASGQQVQLVDPVRYQHDGRWTGRGSRLNAEVGMLSHNIAFTSAIDESACRAALESADALGKQICYGGQTSFLQHSIVRIDNTEFQKMGQGLLMGRYPLHFHLAGDASGSYLRGNSVHRGFNRCVTLHGVFNLAIEGNVCFESHGHNLYLEDGIEAGNSIIGNLVVSPKASATICSDFHDVDWAGSRPSVSGIWITNPNNTFRDNVVVGAQFGVWFTFPTASDAQTPYSDARGGFGGVFGASEKYFLDPASGFGPTSWVNKQEQARTPTIFHNNSIKGSQRNGIFIDGRVTNSEDMSIPCLEGAGHHERGRCGTCPGTAHTFSWAPTHFSVDTEPSSRTYRPVANVFEDIVVAYTAFGVDDFSGIGGSFWASGGAVSFERAIFAYNERGTSLHNPVDWCSSHFYFGVAGYTAQWKQSLFLGSGGQRAFKFYDGGYHVVDSRWVGLEYLAEMRSVSKGNVNGLQMTHSAPLGWFDQDYNDNLYTWVIDSGKVQLQKRTATLPSLADWSSETIVGQWETKHLHLITMDGFGDHLRTGFQQFVYSSDRFADVGWGPGVMEEQGEPQCRMWLKCGYTVWCGTGVDCSPGFACKDFLPQ